MYNLAYEFDRQTKTKDFRSCLGIKPQDNAAAAIRKAKDCDKFLFIVACLKKDKSDSNRGEDCLRGLLGQPIVNDFIGKFLKSIPDPDHMTGTTEWVVCPKKTAKKVRKAFTSNKLDGNEDNKCWDSWLSLVRKLQQILRDKITTDTFKATFEHTGGSFEDKIRFRSKIYCSS